jgi:hypothetical protein
MLPILLPRFLPQREAGRRMELLCEDHKGTYVLPFPCLWVDGGMAQHQVRSLD